MVRIKGLLFSSSIRLLEVFFTSGNYKRNALWAYHYTRQSHGLCKKTGAVYRKEEVKEHGWIVTNDDSLYGNKEGIPGLYPVLQAGRLL